MLKAKSAVEKSVIFLNPARIKVEEFDVKMFIAFLSKMSLKKNRVSFLTLHNSLDKILQIKFIVRAQNRRLYIPSQVSL